MFKTRTLFIVGAGASFEAGLPLGRGLADKISGELGFTFDLDRILAGNKDIFAALRLHSKQTETSLEGLCQAAGKIRKGVLRVPSIDTFLDTHTDDEDVQLCGKVAIAHQILEAERAGFNTFKRHEQLRKSWYAPLAEMKLTGYSVPNKRQCFQNVSFIVFNYDRCIEHFLWSVIQDVYSITEEEAAVLMGTLPIVHPYGKVGHLPWELLDGPKAPLGGTQHDNDLLTLAGEIKTYTEQMDDQNVINSLAERIQQAETIVFLGFHLHEPNMKLLEGRDTSALMRVFATAYGLDSDEDKNVLDRRIRGTLSLRVDTLPFIYKRSCAELFAKYQYTPSEDA